MLLGFFEVTLAISASGFVQLVLCPDSIDNSATGTSGNKDRQNYGDPGLREFHLSVAPFREISGKRWPKRGVSPLSCANHRLLRQIVYL
jgi:hypothetical protein